MLFQVKIYLHPLPILCIATTATTATLVGSTPGETEGPSEPTQATTERQGEVV